ncbi:hypothetical protein CICLE_v10026823mg [Citrus x clementina]|uniref:Uncharacterized protein n=2 Tax=Citrus TaxID=2706 RepID=A0A067DRE8_CITSI|nr:hypothetical protein CICLE_v10026823mg [Citrus x clementina]KDO44150.1 hypothetical protein CISIN_1g037183mg [Citrus sinensis]
MRFVLTINFHGGEHPTQHTHISHNTRSVSPRSKSHLTHSTTNLISLKPQISPPANSPSPRSIFTVGSLSLSLSSLTCDFTLSSPKSTAVVGLSIAAFVESPC